MKNTENKDYIYKKKITVTTKKPNKPSGPFR